MGARGPKPTPKNVLQFRGSWRANLADDGSVNPEIQIPGCPRHLLKEARKEWRRITPELQQLGLITRIDRAALALYCQEYAWWVWHDEMLQRAVNLAAGKRERHDADELAKVVASAARGEVYEPVPYAGGDGFQVETPNGNLTYNPHWVGKNKAGERVDKYLASFGMSPSSRGKVSPSSKQMPLPGMGDTPKEGFGAL